MVEARSRLRMAEEWLGNWANLSAKERQKEPVTNEDRAMMTIAHLNIHGIDAQLSELPPDDQDDSEIILKIIGD
jgi:hypothetical protein